MHRLYSIVVKEFKHLVRDRISLALIILFPLTMLIIHGFAITLDVDHIPYGFKDDDRTVTSRELLERFDASGYFDRVLLAQSEHDLVRALDRGEIRIGIEIPSDFERTLKRGGRTEIQLLIDGADNNTATIAMGYAERILQRFRQEQMQSATESFHTGVELHPRIWFNPDLKSALFIIPGLLGLVLMMTTVVMTSLSIVREKERGTVEGLLASPIRPLEMIIGKLIPYLIVAYIQFGIGLLAAWFVFEIPIRGDLFVLFIATGLFLLVGLSLGMLISTLTDSQQVAWQISFIITMLPSFLLSGFIFPIENMPRFLQGITELFPIRHYLPLIKGVLLKGLGWREIWPHVWPLLIFWVVFVGVSVGRFRKKVA